MRFVCCGLSFACSFCFTPGCPIDLALLSTVFLFRFLLSSTTAFATLAFALPGCLLPCSSGYLVVLSRPFWRRRWWRCVVVRCCLITLLFVRRSRGRPELKSRLCRMDRTVWAGSTAMPQSRGPSFLASTATRLEGWRRPSLPSFLLPFFPCNLAPDPATKGATIRG